MAEMTYRERIEKARENIFRNMREGIPPHPADLQTLEEAGVPLGSPLKKQETPEARRERQRGEVRSPAMMDLVDQGAQPADLRMPPRKQPSPFDQPFPDPEEFAQIGTPLEEEMQRRAAAERNKRLSWLPPQQPGAPPQPSYNPLPGNPPQQQGPDLQAELERRAREYGTGGPAPPLQPETAVPGGMPQPGFMPPESQGPPDPLAGLRGPPGPEPEGIPSFPPPEPQVPGGQPQPGFMPPPMQGPPNPLVGINTSIPPGYPGAGQPPAGLPMGPQQGGIGVPGGQPQPGFFPPQGSWGDTMVDQQRAKVARDAARNPPPPPAYNPLPGNNQPPGPGAGPPNPFAGIGDLMGGPDATLGNEMLTGTTSNVFPTAERPQPPAMMPAGPPGLPRPRPEAPYSGGYPRVPQARPEPPAPYANVGGPRMPQPRPTSTLDVAKEAARQVLRERDDMAARINRDELGADPGGFTAAAAERARQAQQGTQALSGEPAASIQQSAARPLPVSDLAREEARRTLRLHPDTGRIPTAPGLTQFNQPAAVPPAPGQIPLIRSDLTAAAAEAGGRSLTPRPVSPTGIFAPGLPRPRPTNSREEQAVRQTALGVPLPGDLIAGSASPVEDMGSDLPIGSERTPYRLEGGYFPGLTKDDYIGADQDEEDEDTSAGLSAADLAGRGLAVAETTGTYDGGGGGGDPDYDPGAPGPDPVAPAIRLRPLIKEERYAVLPESSRNSQALFGWGKDDDELLPVKHVQMQNVDGPDPFRKFGEPRSGSGLGAWIGGGLGFLGSAYGSGAGLIGTGVATYAGQKLGRKVGGLLGDRETGLFSRFTNPNYARDRAQELADIEANRLAKKGIYLPVAGARGAPLRAVEERTLAPLIADDNPDAVLLGEEGRQRIADIEAQERAAVRESMARESMNREGGGTRTGGLFGSGSYMGGTYGGYGGRNIMEGIGGAYRSR